MTAGSEVDWAEAERLFVAGEPLTTIGKAVGVSRETVRRRALDAGWVRDEELNGTEQTQAARDRHQTRWARRRADEADAAGITAAVARQRLVQALADGDDKMVRAASIAFGIMIDKAQLLSGAATARIDEVATGTDDEALARRARQLDELAERRSQRSA